MRLVDLANGSVTLVIFRPSPARPYVERGLLAERINDRKELGRTRRVGVRGGVALRIDAPGDVELCPAARVVVVGFDRPPVWERQLIVIGAVTRGQYWSAPAGRPDCLDAGGRSKCSRQRQPGWNCFG